MSLCGGSLIPACACVVQTVITMARSVYLSQTEDSGPAVQLTDFVATACTQPGHTLQQSIRDMVCDCVLQVVPGSNIGEADPLMESGADSLGATELCNLLQAKLGDAVQLPTTLVFDYPSIKETAEYIYQQLSDYLHTKRVTGVAASPSVAGVRQAETFQATLGLVIQCVEKVTSGVSKLCADDPLMETGVDSLAAVELQNLLQCELGKAVCLPSSLVFDYPSAGAIANMVLASQHTSVTVIPQAIGVPRSSGAAADDDNQTVIVGVCCRAPGMSKEISGSWWLALARGVDSSQTIPATRFDVQSISTCSSQRGHFLNNAESFDHSTFRMSVAEVQNTDPGHRLLLEVAFSACIEAQHSRDTLVGASRGVFVGASSGDWTQVRRDAGAAASVYTVHGTDSAAIAGRLSYLFGLKGPCFSVSTMCSSSLVALDAACCSMQLKRCDSAIVGGVSLILHPDLWQAVAALSALAPDGRCKTFDRAAGGFPTAYACALKADAVCCL